MNSIVSACLDSLNKINETDFEYEMMACEQLIESYDKLIRLMEHYTLDQIDNIPYLSTLIPSVVFQEAEVINNQNQEQQQADPSPNPGTVTNNNSNDNNESEEKSDDGNKKEKAWEFDPRRDKKDGSGKENILVSILFFIPRLIFACIRFIVVSIKNLFSGKDAAAKSESNVNNAIDEDPAYWQAKLNEFNQELSQKYPSAMLYFDWNTAVNGAIQGGQAIATQNEKTGKSRISVILPVNIEELNNLIQQVVVKHVDAMVNFLTGTFGGMTNANGEEQEPYEVKAESIKQMITAFNNDNALFVKEREKANNILKNQKASKALYVDGAVKYTIIEVYTHLDTTTRTMNALSDRANKISSLVKKLQNTPNKKPLTTEAAQNLKDMDAALKTVINTLANTINDYCLKLVGASTESLKAIEAFITNNPKDANANNTQQNQNQNQNQDQTGQQGSNPPTGENQGQNPPAAAEDTNNKPGVVQNIRNTLNNSKAGQAINNSAVGQGFEWLQGRRKYKYIVTDRNGNQIGLQQSFDGDRKDWKNLVNNVAAAGNKIQIVKEYYYDENGNEVEVVLEHTEYYQDDNISPLEY